MISLNQPAAIVPRWSAWWLRAIIQFLTISLYVWGKTASLECWDQIKIIYHFKVETIVIHLYQSHILVTCAWSRKYGQRNSQWSYVLCICDWPLAGLQVSKQYCLEMDRRRDWTIWLYGKLDAPHAPWHPMI